MKVFISWSGARSRIVALALREWLPNVINAVEPFVSEEDIDKGAVGAEVIGNHLKDSKFGIVCLTRDNQARPWINYEAGALSKVVGDNEARVATLLIDIDAASGVTGPLSAFQATRYRDLADMKKLVASVARAAGDTRSREQLDRVVELLWDSYLSGVTEERLNASGEVSATPSRQPEEMFGELVTLMRQVAQEVYRLSSQSMPRLATPWTATSHGGSLNWGFGDLAVNSRVDDLVNVFHTEVTASSNPQSYSVITGLGSPPERAKVTITTPRPVDAEVAAVVMRAAERLNLEARLLVGSNFPEGEYSSSA